MHIVKKISQHRRDFKAIYRCGHCGHETEGKGYDDANFHESVIPDMTCPDCKKKEPAVTSAPDVPAGVII